MTRTSGIGNFFKNIVLTLTVLALGLYLTEWLLGFYLVKAVPRYPLPPHAVQRHTTVDYDVVYRYNNYGLRSPDFVPGLMYDAVLLGDSFFFGQGVGEGKTLVDVLQKKGMKVLNVSEIATNPIDYYHKLNVMKAQGLRSRAVFVGLCVGNDFQDIADKNIEEALRHRYRSPFLSYDARSFLALERLRYQLGRKRQQLLDWFYSSTGNRTERETVVVHEFEHRRRFAADWLRFFTGDRPELMAAMAGSDKRPLDREKPTEEAYLEKIQLTPPSFYNTVRILKAMPSRLPEGRFYLVLIPGPHYVWGFRSPRYERYLEQLKAQLAPSFTVVDLHGRTKPEMHFLHDGHWNERGHRLVAEILGAAIALRTPQLFQGR
ncbi:MAG: SGNH/GDSL hydrolase family protein [Syntrophobacterales bacterium]|nr:SGNH/GDSL hydrolase family protein [Syntrophobacterales bacterium]